MSNMSRKNIRRKCLEKNKKECNKESVTPVNKEYEHRSCEKSRKTKESIKGEHRRCVTSQERRLVNLKVSNMSKKNISILNCVWKVKKECNKEESVWKKNTKECNKESVTPVNKEYEYRSCEKSRKIKESIKGV